MTSFSIPNLNRLVPMQGVCYSPAPSDDAPSPPQKYFDTDFTNASFPDIWGAGSGSGRNDVADLAGIGANFMHLYDWSVPPAPGDAPGQYQRSHQSYLEGVAAAGMTAMVPVSNYFLTEIVNGNGATVKSNIEAMVKEVYNGTTAPMAGAGMWGIANEYDLNSPITADTVATAMQYLVEAESALGVPYENTLPVTSPVSFAVYGSTPAAIDATQRLQTAINANSTLSAANFWTKRFVASLNPFVSGEALATYISTTFPQYFPDTPFFFAEMGINTGGAGGTEDGQASFVASQLANTDAAGNFIGRCVFQFLNQTAMKSGQEATWGMTKFASGQYTDEPIQPTDYVPGGGSTYRVDTLTQKPLWQTVATAYSGS